MKRLAIFSLLAGLTLLIGCGGGGGGGGSSATLIGRVLSLSTGGPLNPAASVQKVGGSPSTTAELSDGSFTLANVGGGTTQVQVIPNQSGWPLFTFNFAAASGTTAVGDLWVGPEQVTLQGRVLNATNAQPIANAEISFGGQNGKTNASGVFQLAGVGYSSVTQTVFWGLVGTARADAFFKTDFSAAPNLASGGVVDVGDILLTPSSDETEPNPPYNITGKVLPIGTSNGCIVRLKQGGIDVRVVNLDNTGVYRFWIAPGNYTVTFEKGSQTAPPQSVNLTQTDDPVTVPDVTLN